MVITATRAAAISVAFCLAAAPALAGSDYLLQIDSIKGQPAPAAPPAPIEVRSWSFGSSHPVPIGGAGLGAGKVTVHDMSVTRSPQAREAGSGMASGRTAAPPEVAGERHEARDLSSGMASGRRAGPADVDGDGRADVALPPRVGDNAQLTLQTPDSAATTASALVRACASGEHIGKVVLSGQGRAYQLEDVMVSSCAVQAGERQIKLTGHVTLIK